MASIWGKKYWNLFHLLTTKYPDNPSQLDKLMAQTFLNNIDKVLPCPKCANHYRHNLKTIRIGSGLDSKTNFIKWFIDLHNVVNLSLDKKSLSYEEALKKVNNIDQNLLEHFDNILGFVVHILPPSGPAKNAPGIQKFIKSVIYFGKLNINSNIIVKFNDMRTYKMMHIKINKILGYSKPKIVAKKPKRNRKKIVKRIIKRIDKKKIVKKIAKKVVRRTVKTIAKKSVKTIVKKPVKIVVNKLVKKVIKKVAKRTAARKAMRKVTK